MNTQCKDCNNQLKDCTCIEDTLNMKTESNIISNWLSENRNPKIDEQVNQEAKELQKKHLVDMMKSDEELNLYNPEPIKEITLEEAINQTKKQNIKEFINQYPKALTIDELIDQYIEETGYGMDMWSKQETNTFTTIRNILYNRK